MVDTRCQRLDAISRGLHVQSRHDAQRDDIVHGGGTLAIAIDKFCHTVTSAWIIGALFVVAVSCYYLLKGRERELAVASIKIGGTVGLVASLLAVHTGDGSAYQVAKVQPMKLAAMEALYDGGTAQGLTAIALVNPFAQPDYENESEPPLRIAIPYGLSFLATHDINGYVPASTTS